MRISDWSSDVCSSDLAWDNYHQSLAGDDAAVIDAIHRGAMESLEITDSLNINGTIAFLRECGRTEQADEIARAYVAAQPDRSEERRVGKKGVSTFSSRWAPCN